MSFYNMAHHKQFTPWDTSYLSKPAAVDGASDNTVKSSHHDVTGHTPAVETLAQQLRLMHVVWEAVRVWSRVWDLTKPVLVEKTPFWYLWVEGLHYALTNYTELW